MDGRGVWSGWRWVCVCVCVHLGVGKHEQKGAYFCMMRTGQGGIVTDKSLVGGSRMKISSCSCDDTKA